MTKISKLNYHVLMSQNDVRKMIFLLKKSCNKFLPTNNWLS